MAGDLSDKSSPKGKSSSHQDLLDSSEIEELINAHDPEFLADFSDLVSNGKDLNMSHDLNHEPLKLDLSSHFSGLSSGWKRSMGALLPFISTFAEVVDEIKNRLRVFKASTLVYLEMFYSVHFPLIIKEAGGKLRTIPDKIKLAIGNFGRWPLKKKVGLVVLIIATLGTIVLVRQILTTGLIPPSSHLFMHSFEEGADEIFEFQADEKFEPFYESNRSTKNLVLLPKLLTNIKPSRDSGPNPMAAVEVFVEGSSSDAMIEIKDREPEFRDQFSRLIEEMTFAELSTPQGKRALTDLFKKAANSILTTGTVRRVFIKTIIIKP